jgi:hypothetical protein
MKMKILFLKDKDYDKIINWLSDDYMFKELLELFQESVVIPTDTELIPVDKNTSDRFEDTKNSFGEDNNKTLMKLIDTYWGSWD